MLFAGDIMLDEIPGRLIQRGRDPLAAVAKQLAGADIRIGNLESVVSRVGQAEPSKPYTFRAHPRVLPILARHFDAVSVANNHTGDYGSAGFADTLAQLKSAGIRAFGGGTNLADAHRPLIFERNGLRIALLGYNDFMPRSFEADTDKPGSAWASEADIRADILTARSEYGAHLVIPVMHWGVEYEPFANPRQRELAHLMIDAGADAVVGGHPHVTQDIEIYRGKLIVYSLGNFVFNGFSTVSTTTGWLLRLELSPEGLRDWTILPVRLDRSGRPKLLLGHR
jgi:poly-gamma-glutamate synthesis protein (capsule biosynthesis protein)